MTDKELKECLICLEDFVPYKPTSLIIRQKI